MRKRVSGIAVVGADAPDGVVVAAMTIPAEKETGAVVGPSVTPNGGTAREKNGAVVPSVIPLVLAALKNWT